MLLAWAGQYVDLPFLDRGRSRAGLDCWGLCRLIWQEQWGLVVPDYSEGYATAEDARAIAGLIRGELPLWRPVPLPDARPGDALVLRILSQPMHVGLILDPPWFLHIEKGIDSVCERWDSIIWEKRIIGVYRHAGLA